MSGLIEARDVSSQPGTHALLDRLDFYGNNGWSKTPQLKSLVPGLPAECEQAGLVTPVLPALISGVRQKGQVSSGWGSN